MHKYLAHAPHPSNSTNGLPITAAFKQQTLQYTKNQTMLISLCHSQVHVEGHAPGSAGFNRISQALASAVNEAASSLVAPGAVPQHTPRAHATCVQGCVQLLAAIHIPQGALAGSGTAAVVHGLQTALERLVRSRLEQLELDEPLPEFDVTVAADASSDCVSLVAAAAVGAAGAAQLLSCTPPCLAAGAGSTELQLLVDVDATVAAGSSADGELGPGASGAANPAAKLVVWNADAPAAPLVMQYSVNPGLNLLRCVNDIDCYEFMVLFAWTLLAIVDQGLCMLSGSSWLTDFSSCWPERLEVHPACLPFWRLGCD